MILLKMINIKEKKIVNYNITIILRIINIKILIINKIKIKNKMIIQPIQIVILQIFKTLTIKNNNINIDLRLNKKLR